MIIISSCSYAAAKLVDLVNELQEVNNWIHFGLNLGIGISRLEAIEKNHTTIEERRMQLFIYWQNQVVPTWSAVVKALMAIGKRRLASDIAQKHGRYPLLEIILAVLTYYMSLGHIGVPEPEQSDDEDLDQLVNLPQQGEVRRYFKRSNVVCILMTISLTSSSDECNQI